MNHATHLVALTQSAYEVSTKMEMTRVKEQNQCLGMAVMQLNLAPQGDGGTKGGAIVVNVGGTGTVAGIAGTVGGEDAGVRLTNPEGQSS